MQIKTILNRVQKYQSFIYMDFKLKEDKQLKLDITIRPRSNSRPVCSGCGSKCPNLLRPTNFFEEAEKIFRQIGTAYFD